MGKYLSAGDNKIHCFDREVFTFSDLSPVSLLRTGAELIFDPKLSLISSVSSCSDLVSSPEEGEGPERS